MPTVLVLQRGFEPIMVYHTDFPYREGGQRGARRRDGARAGLDTPLKDFGGNKT